MQDLWKQNLNCQKLTETDGLFSLPGRTTSLCHLLRVTALIRRFVNNCRAAAAGSSSDRRTRSFGPLTPSETDEAVLTLITIAQRDGFSEEIAAIRKGRPVPRTSCLFRIRPIISDGLLRVGGRVDHAAISYDARHQLILPQKHRLTLLLVMDYHQKLAHCGQEYRLSKLRERLWIGKGRSVIRSLVRSCIVCRRKNARPATQIMAPLSDTRLQINTNCFRSN